MADGKAKLLRDDYCDGLGDCLPTCPTGKLAPVNAPYFDGAKLLIAADCTAFAYANLHQEFMKGKITLIGCPKLDSVDYSEKLTRIIQTNNIQSVTIIRMEVPCCGGLEAAAKTAVKNSGKFIPWQVVTVSTCTVYRILIIPCITV